MSSVLSAKHLKIGTIFESSHIPMHIWLQAIHLMAASKKGFSTNQLARTLGVSLKSAWLMSHRIREAMKDRGGCSAAAGGIVESDETFFGQNADAPRTGCRSALEHSRKRLRFGRRRWPK